MDIAQIIERDVDVRVDGGMIWVNLITLQKTLGFSDLMQHYIAGCLDDYYRTLPKELSTSPGQFRTCVHHFLKEMFYNFSNNELGTMPGMPSISRTTEGSSLVHILSQRL